MRQLSYRSKRSIYQRYERHLATKAWVKKVLANKKGKKNAA